MTKIENKKTLHKEEVNTQRHSTLLIDQALLAGIGTHLVKFVAEISLGQSLHLSG
jgi:hypothetical protein